MLEYLSLGQLVFYFQDKIIRTNSETLFSFSYMMMCEVLKDNNLAEGHSVLP